MNRNDLKESANRILDGSETLTPLERSAKNAIDSELPLMKKTIYNKDLAEDMLKTKEPVFTAISKLERIGGLSREKADEHRKDLNQYYSEIKEQRDLVQPKANNLVIHISKTVETVNAAETSQTLINLNKVYPDDEQAIESLKKEICSKLTNDDARIIENENEITEKSIQENENEFLTTTTNLQTQSHFFKPNPQIEMTESADSVDGVVEEVNVALKRAGFEELPPLRKGHEYGWANFKFKHFTYTKEIEQNPTLDLTQNIEITEVYEPSSQGSDQMEASQGIGAVSEGVAGAIGERPSVPPPGFMLFRYASNRVEYEFVASSVTSEFSALKLFSFACLMSLVFFSNLLNLKTSPKK